MIYPIVFALDVKRQTTAVQTSDPLKTETYSNRDLFLPFFTHYCDSFTRNDNERVEWVLLCFASNETRARPVPLFTGDNAQPVKCGLILRSSKSWENAFVLSPRTFFSGKRTLLLSFQPRSRRAPFDAANKTYRLLRFFSFVPSNLTA